MSDYNPTAIRNAIREVLEGKLGSTRLVPPGTFGYGTFDGQPAGAQKALSQQRQYDHRFDIKLGQLKRHDSSPLSATAGTRTALLDVTIMITSRLDATVNEAERDKRRARIQQDAELGIQALGYPNNLTTDRNGASTGIVSGMLLGPNREACALWDEIAEDWDQLIHRSRIQGSAIVRIAQVTS